MIALPLLGRLPVRPHLRPQPRLPRLGDRVGIFTEADIDPRVLRICPDIVDHLNLVLVDVWTGEGKPDASWDGWIVAEFPLDTALALPCGGEA